MNLTTAAIPASDLLIFGQGNGKLDACIDHFSLPAGWSCPGAVQCLARAVEKDGGKYGVEDGPDVVYRCFSASEEARYPGGMDTRERYPCDLTDLPWENIEHLFPPERPPPGRPGRRRTYPRREVVNALFYLARSGCSWRMLPHDFPPWGLVSFYFYTWRDRGILERVHHVLRVDRRRLEGREGTP